MLLIIIIMKKPLENVMPGIIWKLSKNPYLYVFLVDNYGQIQWKCADDSWGVIFW